METTERFTVLVTRWLISNQNTMQFIPRVLLLFFFLMTTWSLLRKITENALPCEQRKSRRVISSSHLKIPSLFHTRPRQSKPEHTHLSLMLVLLLSMVLFHLVMLPCRSPRSFSACFPINLSRISLKVLTVFTAIIYLIAPMKNTTLRAFLLGLQYLMKLLVGSWNPRFGFKFPSLHLLH